MVVYSDIDENEMKSASAVRGAEVYRNEYDSFLINVQGLLIRLNKDEFVREARISEDESTAVFLIWRKNQLYEGSNFSRIIAIRNLEDDSSNYMFEYVESLDSDELNRRYQDKHAFVTSIEVVDENFPVVRLFVHRKRSEGDLIDGQSEAWDLIKQERVED